jgi:hypothetical protein
MWILSTVFQGEQRSETASERASETGAWDGGRHGRPTYVHSRRKFLQLRGAILENSSMVMRCAGFLPMLTSK